MVDGQVRPSDVTDLRIVEAMLEVPREAFVDEARRPLAYADADLAVGSGRVLIQPRVLAKLIEAADVAATDKVLEVGSATGYGAAILSRLAASVVALEEDTSLAALAKPALAPYGNVGLVTGRLAGGAPSGAPYDVIVFNGAVEEFPKTVADGLAEGGRLLLVEGTGQAARAMVYRRVGGALTGRSLFNAAVPVLPGFAKAEAFAF
jgi:protein-L-isoaspartate(D-aspartate) O-methyltransferase